MRRTKVFTIVCGIIAAPLMALLLLTTFAISDAFLGNEGRLYSFFVTHFGRDDALGMLMVFGLGLVLSVTISLGCAQAGIRYLKENALINNAIEIAEHVTVISKVVHKDTSYYVAFEFPCGKRENVTVDPLQFNTIAEGEGGLLTYKQIETRLIFVSFRANVQ